MARCTTWFLIGLLVVLTSGLFNRAIAIAGLDVLRDQVGSTAPGEPGVGHNISFALPVDSQQVRQSDWIIIDMPNYNTVLPATEVIGQNFGNAVISVDNKRVLITNIVILPGTGITIKGIVADNPGLGLTPLITVSIAEDSNGTIIRNQAVTLPISTGGFVAVTTTVDNPLSSLNLSGYTGPGAFTTLAEGGAVVGTTVSSGTGFFSFILTGLAPGDHVYEVFSSDSTGRNTSISPVNTFLTGGTITTISGILLSPTISEDKTEIDPGETITVAGNARPNMQINIFLEAPLRAYTTTSNAVTGEWSYTISAGETATFTPGQYRFSTNVQDTIGNQSIYSPTLNFTVRTSDNPPPDCDISHGDLNCDGRTNLTDFSILLFHWQTNHRKADINSDGKVNLTDFSIMMFYFNR